MPMPPGKQMPMPPGQRMSMPMPENPLGIADTRDGSGTSWLPDASPMQGAMRHSGPWMLMLHGNAFVQFTKTGSDRGDDQFGSTNWIMGMAQRELGGGQLLFRTMLSLEPLTVGKCGYPTLLQSGESCNGAALHDRQHPHDVFVEVAADYRRAMTDAVAFELYGGPAGEPALGPTAFPHRLSAMPNPIAPISHHWLDSSHISFGVFTGGVYGRKWKVEASVFNGREPDDQRWDFDFGALDSYSGRLWLMPSPQWAIQVSAGHLREAEFRASGPREDVNRVTASATYHRLVNSRLWATTVAWGQNREANQSTSAITAETAMDWTADDTLFARGEIVGKTTTELVLPLPDDETFTVTKLQIGYTRWLGERHGMKAGLGGSGGLSVVPEMLRPFYGGRAAAEFSVFFAIRPH
ncbi:MAG TPA: hypothetical protein VEL79_02245 [Vicinamibacterales bacterium]|nr:hypothetical protein [Vicinamibacterales bacterium]